MDSFEEWRKKHFRGNWNAPDVPWGALRIAYEAGQASMQEAMNSLGTSLEAEIRVSMEVQTQLRATTPVIEAAERIKSFQYEEIEYPSRKPAAPYSENEFMERAFNDGLDYCAAIAEAALATYRAAVTKEEGK